MEKFGGGDTMRFWRQRLRERISRFMYGRCGYDELSRVLLYACIALAIINLFCEIVAITVIETLLFIYTMFRILSKNLVKRNRENAAYLKLRRRVSDYFKLRKNKRRDRKTHVYHKCPHCNNTLRLPRIKGKHTVNCPCCHTKFDMKVR